MTKRHFFLGILVFLLFAVTNVVFGKQNVYLLTDARKLSVIKKIVEARRAQGMPWKQIVGDLITNNHIQEITPQLARDTFHINWLENRDDLGALPNLLVVNMGQEVGYGLFALDHIGTSKIIAEYTGTVITDEHTFQDNPYVAQANIPGENFIKIDALHEGGAARFAQHLPTKDLIAKGYYCLSSQSSLDQPIATADQPIATANSYLGVPRINGQYSTFVLLIANTEINPFELIGFDYNRVGINPDFVSSYIWPQNPCLFDITGRIIPNTEYISPRTINIRITTDLTNHIPDPRYTKQTIMQNETLLREDIVRFSDTNGIVYFSCTRAGYFIGVLREQLMLQLDRPGGGTIQIEGIYTLLPPSMVPIVEPQQLINGTQAPSLTGDDTVTMMRTRTLDVARGGTF